MRKLYIGLIAAGVLLIGVVIGALAVRFWGVSVVVENPTEKVFNTSLDPEHSTLPPAPKVEKASDVSINYDTNVDLKITWQSTRERLSDTEADKIHALVDPNNKLLNNFLGFAASEGITIGEKENDMKKPVGLDHMVLFKAGTFSDKSSIKNKQVYYWYVPLLNIGIGMGGTHSRFLVFLDDNNKLVSIINSEPKEGMLAADDYGVITGYINRKYPEITAPTTLSYEKMGMKLAFAGWVDGAYYVDGVDNALGVVSVDKYLADNKQGIIKPATDSDYLFTADGDYKVYFKNGCYVVKIPNGAEAAYDVVPNFTTYNASNTTGYGHFNQQSFKPKITWDQKENLNDKYMLYLEVGACGRTAQCSAWMDNQKWFDQNNLVVIGKTVDGEEIYELSDKANSEYYKRLFDFGYNGYLFNSSNGQMNMQDVLTAEDNNKDQYSTQKFQQFLADQPIFFWKDSFGHWYAFRKAKYVSLAECGKPVIYLYPEKETDVQVKVEPNGGFTKTDPFYPKNGWVVRATPDSQLFNYQNQATYPYLFWEGNAYGMQIPKNGFVLKRENVGSNMKKILSKLGLNERETADFLEFWQPKLEVKPFVFVTFVSQDEFDQVAPLTVSPKPDQAIRVFMDYQPLDQHIQVKPLNIQTPVRTGFTVVEWGGRLHQ